MEVVSIGKPSKYNYTERVESQETAKFVPEKKYKMNMDTIGFSRKPGTEKSGAVNKLFPRVSRNLFWVTKAELVWQILHGFSIIPGLCDVSKREPWQGALQKDWVSQDFFALDFDDGQVTKEQVIAKFEELGIPVFFAHETYSSSEEKQKFHVFFCAKETVTDMVLRDKFQSILMSTFAAMVDKQCRNRNRYFNGTNKRDSYYVDYSAEVDIPGIVEKYWENTAMQLLFLPRDSAFLKASRVRVVENKEEKTVEREAHEAHGNIEYLEIPEEYFEEAIPKTRIGYYKRNMQAHYNEFMEIVENLLSTRRYADKCGRHDLLFVTFCMVAFKLGCREAYRACKKINDERFAEPLCLKDFNYVILCAYDHIEENFSDLHSTSYIFKFKTALEKLNVPEEQMVELTYMKKYEEREHASKWREPKKERNELIEKLVSEGLGWRKIKRELEAEYAGTEVMIKDSEIKNLVRKAKAALSGVGQFSHKVLSAASPSPLSKGENAQGSFAAESPNQGATPSTATILEKEEKENEQTSAVEEKNSSLSPSTAPNSLEEGKTEVGGLNKEQQSAFTLAVEGHNLQLIARAGTGKSYTLDKIKEEKEARGERVAVCAATGLAAQAIGGCTLHSLFGIVPGADEFETYSVPFWVAERLCTYDCIVIDEIGMVDAGVFNCICSAIRHVEEWRRHHLQLIIAGDVLQLESVKGSYFFESSLYPSMNFCSVSLEKNMRQTDRKYGELLDRVRLDDRSALWDLRAFLKRGEDTRELYIYPHVADAERKNREILLSLPGEEIDLGRGVVVKIGAKVVVTANAKTGKYFNGMRGTVLRVGKKTVTIETTDGRIVSIRKRKLHSDGGEYTGYPLQLGYALTIHKVQGMTLEAANIDPRCFANGQLYTALSRVKDPSKIYLLADIKPGYMKVNKLAKQFSEQGYWSLFFNEAEDEFRTA